MLHHEVFYTLEKFQIKATIPDQRKNGNNCNTNSVIKMGLTNLVLISIFIVTYSWKACENALPMTLDSIDWT